ncbi:hypothetical protein BCR41DRAFT_375104 [Lobosporangium transversale]|uniref:Uncharacterized protein n=1 Tax=Lobosporangium transversale TaxID=64571 RepID=A0A1Y2G9S2_9FUNG|nr:hypothetical protein BCR41DRAFT_375104 [Lobosporangium transversale]ORZ02016.1 hypothetical protein BCR41DRAFT_375104 [Lobosporangium transversale]|eukprot:XP_021876244.1 hypothetical protein BCR41DRAFT_375104 [Lobosporangium transversale]
MATAIPNIPIAQHMAASSSPIGLSSQLSPLPLQSSQLSPIDSSLSNLQSSQPRRRGRPSKNVTTAFSPSVLHSMSLSASSPQSQQSVAQVPSSQWDWVRIERLSQATPVRPSKSACESACEKENSAPNSAEAGKLNQKSAKPIRNKRGQVAKGSSKGNTYNSITL